MKYFFLALSALLLLLGAYLYTTSSDKSYGDALVVIASEDNGHTLTFLSRPLKLSFSYPVAYNLSEFEVTSTLPNHPAIVLTPVSALPLPKDGEGPPTITIQIFPKSTDGQSLESWIATTTASNFQLLDGSLVPVTISGVPAVRYHWRGLYEGNTIAFIHGPNTILLSGMYLSPEDPIVSDYESLVSSLRFSR